jgi:hypothetical protein
VLSLLRKAEQELDAANTRAAINAAAKPVMLAKAELKRLKQEFTRQPSAVAQRLHLRGRP